MDEIWEYWLAFVGLVACVLLTVFVGRWVGLSGNGLLLLRGGIAVIGVSGISTFLYSRIKETTGICSRCWNH